MFYHLSYIISIYHDIFVIGKNKYFIHHLSQFETYEGMTLKSCNVPRHVSHLCVCTSGTRLQPREERITKVKSKSCESSPLMMPPDHASAVLPIQHKTGCKSCRGAERGLEAGGHLWRSGGWRTPLEVWRTSSPHLRPAPAIITPGWTTDPVGVKSRVPQLAIWKLIL